jgi:hypothetical protein
VTLLGVGGQFAHWTVLEIRGQHIVAACCCGNVRALRAEAVKTGACASSCGCQRSTPAEIKAEQLDADARRLKRERQ